MKNKLIVITYIILISILLYLSFMDNSVSKETKGMYLISVISSAIILAYGKMISGWAIELRNKRYKKHMENGNIEDYKERYVIREN